MNPIPPDKEDTLEVQGTFADLVAKVKRRFFFESQRPLGTSANCVQVTQMSKEDIEVDDDNSVTSKDLAPMPRAKKSVTFSSSTTTNPTLFSSVSTSTSSSSSTRPVTRSTAS